MAGRHCSSQIRPSADHIELWRGTETVKVAPIARISSKSAALKKAESTRKLTFPCSAGKRATARWAIVAESRAGSLACCRGEAPMSGSAPALPRRRRRDSRRAGRCGSSRRPACGRRRPPRRWRRDRQSRPRSGRGRVPHLASPPPWPPPARRAAGGSDGSARRSARRWVTMGLPPPLAAAPRPRRRGCPRGQRSTPRPRAGPRPGRSAARPGWRLADVA
jgi:hypothetical protein